MKNKLKLIVASAVCLLGISYSLVFAGTNGLDLWMSGNNNNKLVEIQSQKHSYKTDGNVEVAFFSNSSFRVTSPKGITVSVESPTHLVITGCDKQQVGQFSATLRKIRPPDAYKGKGIRYTDEIVRLKPGKTAGRPLLWRSASANF